MAYQFFLGSSLAALTTFLPLYAEQRLGASAGRAALLIAGFGVMGIIARLVWTPVADRLSDLTTLLIGLAIGAGISAGLIWASTIAGLTLAWVGTIGLGATGVPANAVSMLAVIRDRSFGAVAHASALVSLAFFAGFAAAPPVIGWVSDLGGGFAGGWVLLVATAIAAILTAIALRIKLHRQLALRSGE
ncbi:MAG: MFS transporter [Pseudonocardia sp.]|nr:MFS transporter [Pseudonocardia sp.]